MNPTDLMKMKFYEGYDFEDSGGNPTVTRTASTGDKLWIFDITVSADAGGVLAVTDGGTGVFGLELDSGTAQTQHITFEIPLEITGNFSAVLTNAGADDAWIRVGGVILDA